MNIIILVLPTLYYFTFSACFALVLIPEANSPSMNNSNCIS